MEDAIRKKNQRAALEELAASALASGEINPDGSVNTVGGWQPIETITTDASHVLFFGNTRLDVDIAFSGFIARNGILYSDSGGICKPTHWMPLPAAPV